MEAAEKAGRDAILALKANQYDMVCNGYEIASGSIRNHLPETMVKAFEITGLAPEDVESRFGGLYRAFQYGAPPHGGMAAGIERMVMLLTGCKTVRDVALFPMNQQANDLLMGAPSDVTPSSSASSISASWRSRASKAPYRCRRRKGEAGGWRCRLSSSSPDQMVQGKQFCSPVRPVVYPRVTVCLEF